MPVGSDLAPTVDAYNRPCLAQDRELLLTLQIVADIAVEDAASLMPGIWIAHQDRDRHRRAGALAEYLAAFFARPLALRPLIPPQVQDMDRTELFRQTGAHA